MADPTAPDVAIVVRAKDRPQTLRRALASIGGQTFANWEAIIVNDGGEAAPVEELLAELDETVRSRIVHRRHPVSVGRWASANAGIAHTAAPLIVLHDDDDTWHPDFLTATVEHLRAHPDEIGVAARIEVIIEQERDGAFEESHRYLLEAHNDEILLTDLLEFNRFVPIGFLYRRALHESIGLYDQSLPAAGDWAFNLAAVATRRIRYVSDAPLAFWHQRPETPGVLGNSVHVATDDHRFADRRFRDDALRAYVRQAGLGLPLYLSATTTDLVRRLETLTEAVARLERLAASQQQRSAQLQEQNDAVLHQLSRTADARVRGWLARQKQRLRRRRS